MQVHQLVEDVDRSNSRESPSGVAVALLRVVEELAAASSDRAVRHSDPTVTHWVLVQRAADHFCRSLAGTPAGQRPAGATLRAALDELRSAVSVHLAELVPAHDTGSAAADRVAAVVTQAALAK